MGDINCCELSDERLLASLKDCAADERRCLVSMLRRLEEVDRRKLYEKKTRHASLYAFLVRELGYSEDAAYRRVAIVRAPAGRTLLYRRLGQGRIGLTVAAMIAKRLTEENKTELLDRCGPMTRREAERFIANLEPKRSEPADRVRFLGAAKEERRAPAPTGLWALVSAEETPGRPPEKGPPAEPAPIAQARSGEPASSRVELRFSADDAFYRSLERARALLRHKYPTGRFAEVFAEALEALLDRIDPDRRAARRERRVRREKPEAGDGRARAPERSRRIPAALRDEVWRRDESRCAYIGADAGRCGETEFLEIDHVVPFAGGGSSEDIDNLRLLCRKHNGMQARRVYGERFMARFSRRTGADDRTGPRFASCGEEDSERV